MQSRLAGVLLSLFVLGCAASVLGACNTTAGLGQDVSATGKAVTNSAEKVKQGL
jgi:predicted small secreted protein